MLIDRPLVDHLPKEHQHAIEARISAAHSMAEYDTAKKSLELTVKYLQKLNPSAAALLKEGLEETLTVHRLRVTGLLRKTLQTISPSESRYKAGQRLL